MTLTSFLTSLVPPQVAKAAAQAAIEKTMNLSPNSPNSPSKKASSPRKQTQESDLLQGSSPRKQTQESGLVQAAATALGAAAAKANVLAHHEELEMQKLTRALIEVQMKKMELKLSHFQEMQSLLEAERRDLEGDRLAFYEERLAFKNGILGSGQQEDHHHQVSMVAVPGGGGLDGNGTSIMSL